MMNEFCEQHCPVYKYKSGCGWLAVGAPCGHTKYRDEWGKYEQMDDRTRRNVLPDAPGDGGRKNEHNGTNQDGQAGGQ